MAYTMKKCVLCFIDNRFRIVSTVINAIWNMSGLNVVLDVH